MSLRSQVTYLSCLLGILALLDAFQPSFALSLSLIAPLKARLMQAKPTAFIASNVDQLIEMMAEAERNWEMPNEGVESAEDPEKNQIEYATYCRAVFQASLALQTLDIFLQNSVDELDNYQDQLLAVYDLVDEAEGRKASYHDALSDLKTPIEDQLSLAEDDIPSAEKQTISSDDQQLPNDSVLMSEVKGDELSYNSAFTPLERLAALKTQLHKNSRFLFFQDPEDLVELRQEELKNQQALARQFSPEFVRVSRNRKVLRAQANLQYAIYNQKAWEASKAIESLQADGQSGEVADGSDIFEERFVEAHKKVHEFLAHKDIYNDLDNRFNVKPSQVSFFKRWKSRNFGRY